MNAQHLAQLALDVWRASGARTEARRDSLVTAYAQTYWGPALKWPPTVADEVAAARQLVRARTRIDELTY